jgi:heme A synthase
MGPTGGPSGLKTERAIRRVGWIALLAACLTAGVMVYGGWVRASGSGLGCPDWPLCKGVLAPVLHKSTAIEFGHRLFAGATITTVAIAAVAAFRTRRDSPFTYRLLLTALLVIVAQAGIGGVTVLTDLHGAAVVAHLALAMASLALLTFGALAALRPKAGAGPGAGRATALLAMGALLMLLGGSLVATGYSAACPGVPLCDGRTDLWPSILHTIHRATAVALGLTLAATALILHRRKGSRWAVALNHGVSFVVAVVVLVGLLNVWAGFPQGLRVLHLGLATLVWWGLASSWALAVLARRA